MCEKSKYNADVITNQACNNEEKFAGETSSLMTETLHLYLAQCLTTCSINASHALIVAWHSSWADRPDPSLPI